MAEITRDQVVDYLSNLPVIQIAELIKELEGKWGVKAAPAALRHRIILNFEGEAEGATSDDVIAEILKMAE